MNYKNNIETYIYAGKVIFLIFIVSFTYVILINVLHIKIECDFKRTFNKDCVSCGLTRGIFQCIKSNYSYATKLNRNSAFYFLYAIWHLQLRFIILVLQNKYLKQIEKNIIYILLADLFLTATPLIIYYLI